MIIQKIFARLNFNLPSLVCGSLAKATRTAREACKVIWIMAQQFSPYSPYEIQKLDPTRVSKNMQKKLKDFELNFDYPLGGKKRFRILHGKGEADYFGFFKSLGIPKFYVAINKKDRQVTRQFFNDEGQVEKKTVYLRAGEIAGVACGILRELPQSEGGVLKAWYICDLKVKEEYRGEHIPTRLLQRGFWRFFQCPRGYAICMNPENGKSPKVASIWQKHGGLSSKTLPLNLYNLKQEHFADSREKLEKACGGKITFKSMKGLKEFEIFEESSSTEPQEWKILHIQHGPKGEKTSSLKVSANPESNHDHLIAAVKGSKLDKVLTSLPNIIYFSSATIIYHGLDPSIFNTILTSEI